MKDGKGYVRDALLQAEHCRDGSTNGAVMKAVYGIVKTERLYRAVFREEPRGSSGLSEAELYEIVESNMHLDEEQRTQALACFQRMDAVCQTLMDQPVMENANRSRTVRGHLRSLLNPYPRLFPRKQGKGEGQGKVPPCLRGGTTGWGRSAFQTASKGTSVGVALTGLFAVPQAC
ncbi:MAG TPA: hypothetical protein VMT24_05245 [Aggregatilineaceae bacterium]|nr:hypothetical protein [Aggregatilineaceae bacterium]